MKMLRLALTATALVGSFATAAIANTCSFSGAYVGGQIGMGTLNSHARLGGVDARFAATGLIGGFHLGFGKQFGNRGFMGVEGWGNLAKNKETHTIDVDSLRLERKNTLGAGILPGMVFGNTRVAAILGYESSKFRYAANGNRISNKRRGAFVPGAKVSWLATERVILGLRATSALHRKKDGIKNQALDVMAEASYKF